MSLVWHILRKDFRRIAGPLGLWLLLVLGHAWVLFEWEGQDGFNPSALEAKRYFVNTFGAIVAGVGFVLAAWTVMEDSLVSTQAFWRTRPLSGGRLLVAKLTGALLMFSVLPVILLTPVWLWCGFSFREWEWRGLGVGARPGVVHVGGAGAGRHYGNLGTVPRARNRRGHPVALGLGVRGVDLLGGGGVS